jgi:hypothetical protein
MRTIGKGVLSGIQIGTISGAALGALIGLAAGQGLAGALFLLVYGAIIGALTGLLIGVVLGLLAGGLLRLVLGPERDVPRRTELAPTARLVGVTAGLTPLLLWPVAGDDVPALLAISAITAVAIGVRAPRIAGIPGFESKTHRRAGGSVPFR